jgi:carboxyl-terminal processing protease
MPRATASQALAPPTSETSNATARPDWAATVLATPPAQPSDPATYLEDTLAWIETHALRRDRVDWSSTLAEARAVASGAHATSDTYIAIRLVLAKLDDRHSFFLEPEQAAEWLRNPGNQDPEARRLDGHIGYVALPSFFGFDARTPSAFATRVQELIRAVDQPPACGWIVDLRQNAGGNMWPMLVGIGPLLGEGEAGATVSSNQRVRWSYRDGGGYADDQLMMLVNNAYRRATPPAVAVLTGSTTGSAGEAITVAFRGRPSTRSFGGPTYGVPTANDVKILADNAVLVLTTAVSADRTGTLYEDSIKPDQPIAAVRLAGSDESPDSTLQAAAAWLRAQPVCLAAA